MLWNDNFQCHIPHIDAQHRALFDQIDRLGGMKGDVSRIPETLDFLEQYTAEHFADEESLHQQTRYPYALEHVRLHQAFGKHLKKMRADYNASGHNLSTLMEMNRAIVAWLTDHILQADKKFAAFFHAQSDDMRRRLRLPRRPWIPESSHSFYERVTGIKLKKDAPGSGGAHTTRVFGSSWTEAMLCGIPAIDDQHKELFRQVDLLRDGNNKDRIPGILRFLADYVVKHFNDEESLHLKSRYPQAGEHRRLHHEFVDTFTKMKQEYDASGGDFATAMKLNALVFEWLREHVMKVDKQFAKYYLARQG